jgi:hypothetical protein
MIRDQAHRDAISSRLMRYRDQNGQDWANIIHLGVSPVKPVFARTPTVIIAGYLVGRGMWRKGGLREEAAPLLEQGLRLRLHARLSGRRPPG